MGRRKPDSIELLSNPEPRYRLLNRDQLVDGDLGEMNFGNGHWVGYQKDNAVFHLYYQQPVKAQMVLLNMLQHTRAHIFPPTKIEVWGGNDKDKLTLLAKRVLEMPKKHESPASVPHKVQFPVTEVKYIRIHIQRLKALPSWHDSKGKPAWVMISEIVVD